MPSTVRVATALITEGKMQEAFEKLDNWVKSKPGATSQPDFIEFCRSRAGAQLAKWRIERKRGG